MSKNNTTEAADLMRIQVTLAAPHTHAGKTQQKGDMIDVTPAQAAWLVGMGIAQPNRQIGD